MNYHLEVSEDKSPVVPVEGGYLLNPGHGFPITVITSRQTTAQKVKSILERQRNMRFDEAVAILADLIYRQGVRFRELDLEVFSGRPESARAIEAKDTHTGFSVARLVLTTWPQARTFAQSDRDATEKESPLAIPCRIVGPSDALTCTECATAMKTFATKGIPKFPIHFGCRCSLILDTREYSK